MQTTTKTPHSIAQNTKFTLLKAIAVFTITMAIIFPLFAIVDESESIVPNICGLAYLGILILIGRTKYGKRWSEMLESANNRIFGISHRGGNPAS